MDTRVAVISIIVENPEAIETLNHLLHEAGQFINWTGLKRLKRCRLTGSENLTEQRLISL